MKKGNKNSGNSIKFFGAFEGKGRYQPEFNELAQIEKSLIELMNDGVFIAQDDRIVYANPALKTMLHYQLDEFTGSSFDNVVAPEFLDLWLERYKKRMGAGPEPIRRYELQFLCKDGTEFIWMELQAKRIQYKGRRAVMGVVRDITRYKELQSELERLSQTDDLTGLPNRLRLVDLLKQAMKSTVRRQEKLAVMFLDLDGFKEINDTLGHDAGDQFLKEAAVRLRGLVRDEDFVGRIGGDEFVVVLVEIKTHDDSIIVAEKILKQFSLPFKYENEKIEVGTSIGISHFPDDGDSSDILLRKADKALYQVKNSGKHGYKIFGA